MDSYYVGMKVVLRPTEGCYQKTKQGIVVGVSPTRVVVRFCESCKEVTYLKSNGQPFYRMDKVFPCYVMCV